VDVQRDVLALSDVPLRVAPDLKTMESALFRDAPMRFKLPEKPRA
jgi:acyl CoA:acetate/3-ketoacid CoA transferase